MKNQPLDTCFHLSPLFMNYNNISYFFNVFFYILLSKLLLFLFEQFV